MVFNNLKRQNFLNIVKILFNIIMYVCIKILFKWNKSTEELLLRKMFLKCKLNWYNIIYYFDLLTFLNNFETKKYLDIVLDEKYWTMIDIWSNIWRISRISILHNKNINKLYVLCDPNPYVFKLSKKFYEKSIQKHNNVYFLNNAISDVKTKLPFFMLKWNELDWIWSLDEKNLPKTKTKKIIVESITFSDIIEKIDLWNSKLLVKIDVEWHEINVLKSIIDFFIKNKYTLKNIDLLVEIWEENVENIHNYLRKTWNLKEFRKISFNDYFIILWK
jgi:FkbM family methyltransferase